MTPKPAVRVDGLRKRYRLGERTPMRSARRQFAHAVSAPAHRLLGHAAPPKPARPGYIWAVDGVSFEAQPGEIVGLIGRNGAGKTSMLRLLAGVSLPTEGRIETRGKVGALLAVGTGFHPELTGRENVYMNGAVLGMRRAEVRREFDEIVAFAGVEEFIDTPVKRYSSGMGVRLGFAVAAYLDTDVLFVDEVLAVGDAEFQKRCLNQMEDASGEGRTVVFVSHSMPSILRLCPRVILLEHGKVVVDGPAQDVVHRYLSTGLGTSAARSWKVPEGAPGGDVARLRAVRVLDRHAEVCETVEITEPIDIEVEYWSLSDDPDVRPVVSVGLMNEQNTLVFVTSDAANLEWSRTPRRRGVVRSRCQVPGNLLAEGLFFIQVAIHRTKPAVRELLERDVVAFMVMDRSKGEGARGEIVADWPGVVRPKLDWSVEILPLDAARPG